MHNNIVSGATEQSRMDYSCACTEPVHYQGIQFFCRIIYRLCRCKRTEHTVCYRMGYMFKRYKQMGHILLQNGL